jgi:hydrophobe/amphiphile efflux-3 (HAE3) family protein
MWERLAGAIVRRPMTVLACALVVTVGLGTGLTRLAFSTDQETLVDSGSQVYVDNLRYQEHFGGETMLVLFTGDPVALFSEPNLSQMQALEDELRSTDGVATVVGPYSGMSYAVDQLAVAPGLIADAAGRAEDPEAFAARTNEEAARLAEAGETSLSNPAFVRFLLFEADGTLRDAQRAAFPDDEHALLVAQIEGNASIDEQAQVSTAVEDVVGRHELQGQEVLVTGTPALIDEINAYLQGGMATLGAIALVAMIVVLGATFRARFRLLPIAVMLLGTAAALGAAVLVGIDLSLVTISGLPIFIGLGVDFAIQMHNRYEEQRRAGDPVADAVRTAMTAMATPLTVAMIAGAAGFLALRLSPVPMIRDFGVLLCLGVVILVSAAIVFPLTILRQVDRAPRPSAAPPVGIIERVVAGLTTLSRPVVVGVVAIGAVAAVVGFVLEDRVPVDTEVEHWVSPDSDAVRELEALRSATGFSTQLGLMVEADDVTAPAVVEWMYRFQTAELARHPDALLQVASMPSIAADVVGIEPVSRDITTLLDVTPSDIRRALITDDGAMANIQFMLGDMSLAERADLMDEIDADLRGDLAPPDGVTVTQSGLAVIGIKLVEGMEANRRVLTLSALALVAAALLVLRRFRLRALLPVVPVAVAVGLAMLLISALGFELTPLTTVAAPLVIAVATEFTVLLEARYREERASGRTPLEACAALTHIGRAFVASGLTLLGGFAVMAASPMPLLRDFGIVVAIDVLIALVSALVIMPPLLRWTDTDHRRDQRAEALPAPEHRPPPELDERALEQSHPDPAQSGRIPDTCCQASARAWVHPPPGGPPWLCSRSPRATPASCRT